MLDTFGQAKQIRRPIPKPRRGPLEHSCVTVSPDPFAGMVMIAHQGPPQRDERPRERRCPTWYCGPRLFRRTSTVRFGGYRI